MNLKCFLFLIGVAFLPGCNKEPELLQRLPYTVYPNPCRDFVYLDANLSSGEVMSVKLLGTRGDKIAETEFTTTLASGIFDVSEEVEGQLYFEIEYLGKLYREKVIKKSN